MTDRADFLPGRTGGTAPARSRTFRVLADVSSRPGYRLAFVVLASGIAFAYSLLLPFAFTGRISFANWAYLNLRLLGFALALGVGMAGVLTVQFYAVRRVYTARRAAAPGAAVSGLALVASVVPSLLCCTPVVPTLLAAAGLSGMTLFAATGTIQYVFAVHETAFLDASLVLLVATGWWSARRTATAACLQACCASDGCAISRTDATDQEAPQ